MHRRLAKVSSSILGTLAASVLLLATGCGKGSDGSGANFAPNLASSGTGLRSGAGAAILSPSLGTGVAVRVTYDPHGLVAPPNDAWEIVPGTLRVSFSAPLRASHDAGPGGVRLTFPYPQERSEEILASRELIVIARYGNGSSLRWPELGDFDIARGRVTVDVPSALLDGATTLTAAIGVANRHKLHEVETGPRYWTGSDWQKTGDIKSGVDTVVLIHGIFSSVETAFPTGYYYKCPNDIAYYEKFKQVLGFDYDFTQPPQTEGPLFAAFVKKILNAQPKSLTIEAHSYGSVVTLAALSKLGSGAKIANLVTLGGPLPLRGTPLAEKRNGWRMDMMLGLLDWYLEYPPDVVDQMLGSGMVASLATNSDDLKKLLSDYKGLSNKPHFVQVAGTDWICFIPGIGSCTYSEETFKKILVDDGKTGVTLPWDGVVETLAAESKDIPDAVASEFKLSHTKLECDRDVMRWVAKQLQ